MHNRAGGRVAEGRDPAVALLGVVADRQIKGEAGRSLKTPPQSAQGLTGPRRASPDA